MNKNPRDKTYKLMIDAYPKFSFVITSFFLLLLTITSISVVYLAPYPTEVKVAPSLKLHLNLEGYLTGTKAIEATLSDSLNFFNQEINFLIFLSKSDFFSKLQKTDVNVYIELFGGDSLSNLQKYSSGNYTRSLSCKEGDYYCNPITIMKQRFISYKYYKVLVKFNNLNNLYKFGFFGPKLEARYEYTTILYTQFSTYLRGVFTVMSIFLFFFYIIYLFWKQKWSSTKTEQKWIILLFLSLIFFNNPVYIFDYVSVNWVMPFLNIFFTANFASLFLLFVMIMAGAFTTKIKDRGFWFYFPKFALVGIIWVSVIVVLMWERLNQSTDGAYDLNELPFFIVFQYLLISIFAICILMIGYSIAKAFADGYPRKFKYFAFITFLVILSTLIDYTSFFIFNNEYPAQWLSFYPIYNYYMIIVSILFLPSNYLEDNLEEKFKQVNLDDIENSNFALE